MKSEEYFCDICDVCETFSLIVQRYYLGWEGIMLADTMGCDGVRYDTIK